MPVPRAGNPDDHCGAVKSLGKLGEAERCARLHTRPTPYLEGLDDFSFSDKRAVMRPLPGLRRPGKTGQPDTRDTPIHETQSSESHRLSPCSTSNFMLVARRVLSPHLGRRASTRCSEFNFLSILFFGLFDLKLSWRTSVPVRICCTVLLRAA